MKLNIDVSSEDLHSYHGFDTGNSGINAQSSWKLMPEWVSENGTKKLKLQLSVEIINNECKIDHPLQSAVLDYGKEEYYFCYTQEIATPHKKLIVIQGNIQWQPKKVNEDVLISLDLEEKSSSYSFNGISPSYMSEWHIITSWHRNSKDRRNDTLTISLQANTRYSTFLQEPEHLKVYKTSVEIEQFTDRYQLSYYEKNDSLDINNRVIISGKIIWADCQKEHLGTLILKKYKEGNTSDTEHTFAVRHKNGSAFGCCSINKGTAFKIPSDGILHIKDGDTAEVFDLPYGKYSVHEQPSQDKKYRCTYSNLNGSKVKIPGSTVITELSKGKNRISLNFTDVYAESSDIQVAQTALIGSSDKKNNHFTFQLIPLAKEETEDGFVISDTSKADAIIVDTETVNDKYAEIMINESIFDETFRKKYCNDSPGVFQVFHGSYTFLISEISREQTAGKYDNHKYILVIHFFYGRLASVSALYYKKDSQGRYHFSIEDAINTTNQFLVDFNIPEGFATFFNS
ncbi:MAG: hypothetical protein LKE48_09610 [Solobacterium sp.]|jgi:hypothetical protein|nr:hypothetical protein [Solobacterium sp.]